jgi:hypothetical protein
MTVTEIHTEVLEQLGMSQPCQNQVFVADL